MEKYRKVIKPKGADEEAKEDEVRITQKGKVRNSISYVTTLFEEKKLRQVTLKAMGNAISKLVSVVEIVKRRVAGLHQLNVVSSMEVVDVYEPLEEGLDTVEQKRFLTCLNITLSLDALDTTHYGYQPPIDSSQVITQEEAQERRLKDNSGRRPHAGKPRKHPKNQEQEGSAATGEEDDEGAPVATNGNRGGRSRRGRGNRSRGRRQDAAKAENSPAEHEEKVSVEQNGEKPTRGGRRGRGSRRGRGRGRKPREENTVVDEN